jgi:hypothetical protein
MALYVSVEYMMWALPGLCAIVHTVLYICESGKKDYSVLRQFNTVDALHNSATPSIGKNSTRCLFCASFQDFNRAQSPSMTASYDLSIHCAWLLVRNLINDVCLGRKGWPNSR